MVVFYNCLQGAHLDKATNPPQVDGVFPIFATLQRYLRGLNAYVFFEEPQRTLKGNMKPEERAILVLTHLLTIIPLWGLLVASLVWLYYKEKSRAVVFQAQQAVFYHMILLAGLSVGILFHLFCSIVTGLSESIAEMLTLGNYVLMIVFAAVLLCGCIIAAWKVSEGKEFTYPFIGKKLKEEEKE